MFTSLLLKNSVVKTILKIRKVNKINFCNSFSVIIINNIVTINKTRGILLPDKRIEINIKEKIKNNKRYDIVLLLFFRKIGNKKNKNNIL